MRWAAANIRIPWFAIGGITLENLDEVLAAGAQRICVVSAILYADDLAAACRKFKDRLPRPSGELTQPPTFHPFNSFNPLRSPRSLDISPSFAKFSL